MVMPLKSKAFTTWDNPLGLGLQDIKRGLNRNLLKYHKHDGFSFFFSLDNKNPKLSMLPKDHYNS
jgi:hypothetical protein